MAIFPIERPHPPEENTSEDNSRELEAHPTPEVKRRLLFRKKHGPISQKQMMGQPSDETTSELGREKESIENFLIDLIDNPEKQQEEETEHYPKGYYEARWLLRKLPQHIREVVIDEAVKNGGGDTQKIIDYLKNELKSREEKAQKLPDHMPQSTKDTINKLHVRPEPRQRKEKK